GRHLVITTHGSVDLWVGLSDTPLDFAYVPTSMGGAPALGLGLALARPERGIVVVNGDGATLMNLGSLVTIAGHPAHWFLIVVDNGVYEGTGDRRADQGVPQRDTLDTGPGNLRVGKVRSTGPGDHLTAKTKRNRSTRCCPASRCPK